MGIFDWLLGRRGAGNRQEHARAAEVVERIIGLTNPRLRNAKRYQARLIPAVQTAMAYAESLVAAVPSQREASAAAWQSDAYLRAFFASADDLARAFSRSTELRAWFDTNPAAQEASVVLSMLLVERRTLGVALEGNEVRRDVPQTTVSFTDYRARICGSSEPELRQDIERRIVDQLAIIGVAKAVHDQSQRELLEQERGLLRTRLRVLESQGAGLAALGGKSIDITRFEQLHADLAANEASLRALAPGPQALEYQLERVRDVLEHPGDHFFVAPRRLRLNRMNVVLGDTDPGPAEILDLQVAQVPVPDAAPELRTFVLVRFARNALLPRDTLLDEAARMLG